MNDLIQRWVRDEVRAISAYHVPSAHGMVKLDAMENPYGWSDHLQSQWQFELSNAPLNRYPDPAANTLRQRLRHSMNIPACAEIMLGNGSDELIQIMAMAVTAPGRTLLAPAPGFVMYDMISRFTGLRYVGVPLQADFNLDMPAMLEAIETHQPAIVFIAYPNNPTGNLFKRDDVKRIIEAAPGLVVLDEAYHAFAGDSFMNELANYPQLVVMRTVSKMGLAGLRLGYMAASPDWIREFDKVRMPYNINVLTQITADFALRHRTMFDLQTQQICADRAQLVAALSATAGLQVFPTQANFILFRVQDVDATAVFEGLKQRKVLIKNLSGQGGLLSGCLRVTVGTSDENAQFLNALNETLAQLRRA
ncbi:MAG: histidinol-phosphate transaminase [Gammaproteobacteria bacterium]|nr:histidinol-phosphate transaminase [Gammaproteobacteria bacterium]